MFEKFTPTIFHKLIVPIESGMGRVFIMSHGVYLYYSVGNSSDGQGPFDLQPCSVDREVIEYHRLC